MNDTQLSALRTQPSPEFASRLRETLAQQDRAAAAVRHDRWRAGRLAASVAIVVASGAALTIPSVRASAQSFLAMFREVRFVAVPVDRARIEAGVARLGNGGLGVEQLIGDNVEMLSEDRPLVTAQSADEAGAIAGYDVRQPAGAADLTVSRVTVAPARAFRVIADADRLQEVMDFMGISDLTAPRAMNGAAITIRVPSVVGIKYGGDGTEIEYVQAPTPQLEVPDTVDVRALGEIGLRLIGLSPLQARRFADTIDWTSTLVVPVPPMVSQFEQVSIGGHEGVFMQAEPAGGGRTAILLWSAGGRVYMLNARGYSRASLLQMASSIG